MAPLHLDLLPGPRIEQRTLQDVGRPHVQPETPEPRQRGGIPLRFLRFLPNLRLQVRHPRERRVRPDPRRAPEWRIRLPGCVNLRVADPLPGERPGKRVRILGRPRPDPERPGVRELPPRREQRGQHGLDDVPRILGDLIQD